MLRQRTIKRPVATTGIGLHSGNRVEMTLRPAAVDAGIVFHRVDLDPPVTLRAEATAVSDTQMASILTRAVEGAAPIRIATVEHLMSALAGLGVDNAHVDVTADEIPILDGSSGSFVYLIQSAGLLEQNAPKRFIEVTEAVEVRDGDKWARLEPHFGFKMEFSIDFAHPVIDATGQVFSIDFANTSYVKEVARARTFGFLQDFESLRQIGLAQGGSLGNAIVMDDHRVLNNDGLRFDDEFVKHKVLDAIGDLYLIGHPLLAAYRAHKSGHGLNNKLLRALLDKKAYRVTQFTERREAPRMFAEDWSFA